MIAISRSGLGGVNETLRNTYQVHGSPWNISAKKTLAKCITAAPIACLDVSKNL